MKQKEETDKDDSQVEPEIEALKREYDWLIDNEVSRVLQKVKRALIECCSKLPLPNKVAPYVTPPTGAGLLPEKFVLASQNSDAVRCVLTVLGDNVVQAEVAVKHPKAPGHVYRATAQPDVQWKLQQIQDVANYILKALEEVRVCCDQFHTKKSTITDRAEELCAKSRILEQMGEVSSCIQKARNCLMIPKRRALTELQDFRPTKCFNPVLPSDLLLSFYILSNKLICAAYHLQTPSVAGKQTFHVLQGECPVQWLADLLCLLHSSLLIMQQLQDKLSVFHNCKELRDHILGASPSLQDGSFFVQL